MAYAFDTLGYANHLKKGGVPAEQAETHAEAARDFIMAELATKTDLLTNADTMRQEMVAIRRDLEFQIKNLELRMVIALGVTALAIVSALTAVIKL